MTQVLGGFRVPCELQCVVWASLSRPKNIHVLHLCRNPKPYLNPLNGSSTVGEPIPKALVRELRDVSKPSGSGSQALSTV